MDEQNVGEEGGYKIKNGWIEGGLEYMEEKRMGEIDGNDWIRGRRIKKKGEVKKRGE